MKYALITGASSGIGYELASCFAHKGVGLILISSNLTRLEAAKARILADSSIPVELFVTDLSQSSCAQEIYDFARSKNLQVHYLINNAGVGSIGPSQSIPFVADERMLTLNVIVPTLLCKLFVTDMYRRKEGHILNVSSTGAFQPGPYTASYFASKSYLLDYSRALRFEAKKHSVNVSTLCPGTTATSFFERAGVTLPRGAMSAKKVACIAYKQLHKKKAIIIPGMKNRLLLKVPEFIRIFVIAKVKSRKST